MCRIIGEDMIIGKDDRVEKYLFMVPFYEGSVKQMLVEFGAERYHIL